MATRKSERIKIWIITIIMMLGTGVSLTAMGLSFKNSQNDQEKAYADYLEQQELAAKLNASNSEALSGYSTRTFDAVSASDLKVEVLVQGAGDAIKESDTINVSYFGWLSDGTIFDSSKKKETADAPISFSLNQVIEGWTKGIAGQKAGSVIRLTIPADMAYGASGSGAIPANAPLEFIVEIHQIEAETDA